MEDLLQFKSVEGRVSYTMGLDTENVILANDLAFMPERNWIVFRNGQYPVWNRDETVMPMAYRLLADQPPRGVGQFSFQNLPSLSNAGAYDPRQDTPDFEAALRRVTAQAMAAAGSTAEYLAARGLGETETRLMDPDFYAEQVMGLVQTNAAAGETLDDAIRRLRARVHGRRLAGRQRASRAVPDGHWRRGRWRRGWWWRSGRALGQRPAAGGWFDGLNRLGGRDHHSRSHRCDGCGRRPLGV
jgi:hypothetical protein